MRNVSYFFCFLLIIVSANLYSQQKQVPANIDEAIQFLISDSPDSFKQAIKSHKDDTLINFIDPLSVDKQPYKEIETWTNYDQGQETNLQKFYSNLGITSIQNIRAIILICFKNYLNTGITKHDVVIKPFQITEKQERAEDKVRYKTDSLRGNYIPKDINDCFKILNHDVSESAKDAILKIAEKDVIGKTHLALGTWMRNRWQLWMGSRLTKYFNNMGIFGAENISSIILISYHRHLNNVPINFSGQIKKKIIEQKALQEPTKKMFPKGSGNLEFKSGLFYERSDGNLALAQIGTSVEGRDVWLYDYYFGWAKISYDELRELNYGPEGERESILMKIFKKSPKSH